MELAAAPVMNEVVIDIKSESDVEDTPVVAAPEASVTSATTGASATETTPQPKKQRLCSPVRPPLEAPAVTRRLSSPSPRLLPPPAWLRVSSECDTSGDKGLPSKTPPGSPTVLNKPIGWMDVRLMKGTLFGPLNPPVIGLLSKTPPWSSKRERSYKFSRNTDGLSSGTSDTYGLSCGTGGNPATSATSSKVQWEHAGAEIEMQQCLLNLASLGAGSRQASSSSSSLPVHDPAPKPSVKPSLPVQDPAPKLSVKPSCSRPCSKPSSSAA